ncbi:MAG: SagB/ThcOx family dehydrogenase [Archaeoglobaceae archaeon]|nr:SagB/ThcOx family dehydrogenase [Archaeoglobaceae archaeon]MDW8118858.1 SagB/ThcOx family dehydrogenase [Archaeoglobaceae archaeon]
MLKWIWLLIAIALSCCVQPSKDERQEFKVLEESDEYIKLPEPSYDGNKSLEKSLMERRSIREYSGEPLTLKELSQLLWAGQGITDPRGFRTAPSAGALYPLELFVVIGRVEGIEEGVYRYIPEKHALVKVLDGDKREELSAIAVGQKCVKDAAIDIVITAIYERTTVKYKERGIRYVHFEVGHSAQNILLQAAALDLGAVPVGAFDDERLKELLKLSVEQPLYIIAIGKKT